MLAVACATPNEANEPQRGVVASEAKADCSLVRCAEPLCGPNQHLAYQGDCCPTCVGPTSSSSCATVLCAPVVCPEGEVLVFKNKNDCCGTCAKQPAVKECTTDADCPQYYCITCPCPYSECQGTRCVTRTPDESTCGGTQ
jgi:hypothetical protein